MGPRGKGNEDERQRSACAYRKGRRMGLGPFLPSLPSPALVHQPIPFFHDESVM